MKFLLLDTIGDTHYTGNSYAELIEPMHNVEINLIERYFNIGNIDKCVYSSEYTQDELLNEMSRGVITFLCDNSGFILYKQYLL
jgi:hypothetical protein